MTAPQAQALLEREERHYRERHPRSRGAFAEGEQHYLYGAPMHWMRRWAGGFPLCAARASAAHLWCVDGFEYVDFCLGDTGAMAGHAAPAVTAAVGRQLAQGATMMLPTEDARWVGAELVRRFGLPYWGFTTSASDANRAAIRIARLITGREVILVFNGCYHGSVEEAHVGLAAGRMVMRSGVHPNAVDHARVSRVVEFNDPAALEAALAPGDVALVLAEPCMTNYGLIEAEPGFLPRLRELTRRTGTLLLYDETHTWSAGPGGYTAREALDPDIFTIGKAIGGGIPVGLYGVSQGVAERLWEHAPRESVRPGVRQSSHLGFGGTLAGSAVQVAAVRAVLSEVLTGDSFAHMITLATDLARRCRTIVARCRLPWVIAQSGARVETLFAPCPPRDASQLARTRDGALESLLHLYMLNRGVLITPFHSMLLICPATTAADVERYVGVFQGLCEELSGSAAG
ncbi:MAG TPA: transaminase [Steroidobacteraceae bacterium]|nr:transaminase [Steroidobacteraceae bacterium]